MKKTVTVALILGTILALGIITTCRAAETPKLFAPEFAIGAGSYSPADLGYIRAWKGVDVKSYVWGQVENPAWKNLGVVLRVEQVIQRLPDGRRPNTAARVEVGWKF